MRSESCSVTLTAEAGELRPEAAATAGRQDLPLPASHPSDLGIACLTTEESQSVVPVIKGK